MTSTRYRVMAEWAGDQINNGLKETKRILGSLGDEGSKTAKRILDSERAIEAAGESMTRIQRRALNAFRRTASQLDKNERAADQYRKAVRSLDRALEQGLTTQKEHARLLGLAEDRYKSATKGAGFFAQSLKKARGAAIGLGIAIAAATPAAAGVVNSGNLEEQLERQLSITLKSQEAAVETVERIRDLSASTPLQVENLTTAWISLRTRGLEPTEKKLLEIGDLAAGNRKSLDQTVEALLDAQSLEFERLKEFGIRARKEGDQVALTYAGVTKVVEGTADVLGNKVVDALLEISRANFAGSLESQAETLTGKWSTFSDLLGQLGGQVFRSGVGDALKGLVELASDGVRVITEYGKTEADLTKFIEEQTRVWDANAAAIERRNKAFQGRTPGDQASEEGKQLLELVQRQNQLQDAIELQRERLREAQADLKQATSGRGTGDGTTQADVDELSRQLRELQRDLEDNRYAIDNQKESMALMAQASRETGGDLSKLTGLTGETNEALAKTEENAKAAGTALAKLGKSKLEIFTEDAKSQVRILEELLRAAQGGATNKQLAELEERLKLLKSLGIDLDETEAVAAVDQVREQLRVLRAELENNRPIEVEFTTSGPDVIDLTGSPDSEPAPVSLETDPEEIDTSAYQEAFASVSSNFRDGLIGALQDAAAEGRISFETVFDFLLSQADNLAQYFQRIASVQASSPGLAAPTGGGSLNFGGLFRGFRSPASTGIYGPTINGGNIASTSGSLSTASTSISAVAGVLGAYYQLYTAVDGYVDKKKWERANQGSIRLKETIEGEVQGAIKTVGRDVFNLLSGLADSATEVLQDIVGQFGGTTSGLGLLDLELKVTDANQFSVLVNGFEREFGTASQEAFDFFITRALKSVDVEGVSSEIRQTLKNSRTDDLSTLEQELALAQQIAQLDFTDAQLSTEQFKTSLDELTDFAAERAFELSSFTRIGAASAREWVAFRATITGEQADPATLFAERSASFNRELARYRSEVEAQFQDYVDELLGLTSTIGAGMAESTEQLRQIRTGGGLFNQQGGGANNERPIDTATRITGGILDTAALTEAQAQELESRLAALRALLDGLPDPISPDEFRRGGGGRGRGRKERRENFQEELDRLRLDLDGASDVALTLRDWRLDLEREAEELRKAKVAEILIEEWREIQETLRRGDLLESVRDRGRQLGETDLETSLHNLLEAHIAEREEADLLGVTREEMTEIIRVQRGELEELVEQNRLARQEFADLAAGISEWDRQVRDSQEQFAEWRREEIALNEALGGSAEDLSAALNQLQEEQSAATDSLFGDLLSRIDAAGGEIPNFAENLITMEYALLRADLALAATTQGFEDFLAVQGTSLEQVLASINQAEQDALANLNGPSNAESVYRSRLEAQLRARQDEARDLSSALESVQSALEQLRDDPTQTTTERFQELQSRYLEVLARAQTGDADAVREAARLAIELRDAGQTAFGGSRAAFRNLLADSRGDLEGLLDLQPSLEELGQTQIDLLAEINRNVGNWEPVVEVVLPIDPLVDAIDNLSIQVANPPLPVAVPVDPSSPPAPVDEPSEVPPPRPPPIPPQPPIPPPPVPPPPPPPAPPPPPDSPPNVPVPRLTGGEDELLAELRKLNANFERFERKVSTQDMAVIRGTRRG